MTKEEAQNILDYHRQQTALAEELEAENCLSNFAIDQLLEAQKIVTRQETIKECIKALTLPENNHGELCDIQHCGVDCPISHAENSIQKLKAILEFDKLINKNNNESISNN